VASNAIKTQGRGALRWRRAASTGTSNAWRVSLGLGEVDGPALAHRLGRDGAGLGRGRRAALLLGGGRHLGRHDVLHLDAAADLGVEHEAVEDERLRDVVGARQRELADQAAAHARRAAAGALRILEVMGFVTATAARRVADNAVLLLRQRRLAGEVVVHGLAAAELGDDGAPGEEGTHPGDVVELAAQHVVGRAAEALRLAGAADRGGRVEVRIVAAEAGDNDVFAFVHVRWQELVERWAGLGWARWQTQRRPCTRWRGWPWWHRCGWFSSGQQGHRTKPVALGT
ncbi:unnamed protein product, partial [Pelagomonas calceolata]